MTTDRAERERAAMADKGLAPIPIRSHPMPSDVAACGGTYHERRQTTVGLCYGCARYGHHARVHIAPAAFNDGSKWDCPNFLPLVSADQVAAVDETAGMGHATHGAPANTAAPCLPVGGPDVQHSDGGSE